MFVEKMKLRGANCKIEYFESILTLLQKLDFFTHPNDKINKNKNGVPC